MTVNSTCGRRSEIQGPRKASSTGNGGGTELEGHEARGGFDIACCGSWPGLISITDRIGGRALLHGRQVLKQKEGSRGTHKADEK